VTLSFVPWALTLCVAPTAAPPGLAARRAGFFGAFVGPAIPDWVAPVAVVCAPEPLDPLDPQAGQELDLAVHQTLTHGGTIEVIGEEHHDLEPVGGVAALLRF